MNDEIEGVRPPRDPRLLADYERLSKVWRGARRSECYRQLRLAAALFGVTIAPRIEERVHNGGLELLLIFKPAGTDEYSGKQWYVRLCRAKGGRLAWWRANKALDRYSATGRFER